MTTTNRTIEPPRTDRDDTRADRRARVGWHRLQTVAAWAAIASFAVPMIIDRSVEGFFVAMIAPFVIGLLLRWRWRRVGAVWLGVVSVAELASSAPFLADALTHPESATDFVPIVVFVLSTLVCSVAAVPAFRQAPRPDTPSRSATAMAAAAVIVLVGATAVSVVAASGVDSAQAQAGDIALTTTDFQFNLTRVSAPDGTVGVAVTNDDTTRHTFTIDALGVDLNVPPGTTQRVTFPAESGSYRFYCIPHAPDMAGELIVQ